MELKFCSESKYDVLVVAPDGIRDDLLVFGNYFPQSAAALLG
jgi:hypothetical protein